MAFALLFTFPQPIMIITKKIEYVTPVEKVKVDNISVFLLSMRYGQLKVYDYIFKNGG